MEQYVIKGGNPLVGEVEIAGAKNAAILAAQMIGLADPDMMRKVEEFKKAQAEKVLANSYLDL